MADAWQRGVNWAVGGTLVFTFAHVADELWSRWDAGASVASAPIAAIMGGSFAALGFATLAGTLAGRTWGYSLAVLMGAFAIYSGGTHLFQTDGMDAARWTVVALQIASGVALVVLAIREFVATRATRPVRPVGG